MVYLAGDIGGTKTHLALYEAQGEKVVLIAEKKYPSKDYSDLKQIVKEFWDEHPAPLRKACFGIAGPVRNNVCKATNLPWVIDAKEMELELGIDEVFLLNDLEANAYGVKTLDNSNFYVINRGTYNGRGNQALISAGTGLGEAGFYYDGTATAPFACEGGHTDFAPRDEIEIKLLTHLQEKYGHVSYERILSGPGFYELYQFFTDVLGRPKCPRVEERDEDSDPSIMVSREGVRGYDPTCREVVERFVSIYGAEAGNLALKFLATGGIYIGGGIAPKILEKMKGSNFLHSFINKGRFSEMLRSIPVKVVLDENTALKGAAFYCHNPS